MRNWIFQIFRGLVGLLFVVSGLIKLNDPLGFSFKLEEYFSAAVFDLTFLTPFALTLSIFIVILEVILGVALWLGLWRRMVVLSLLGLISFFTFLTFYSAYYNKVTDCGCFGDAIKLTPWESFTKDVILLAAILVLYRGYTRITLWMSRSMAVKWVFATLVSCFFMAYWVLNHLPLIDFRPYKLGTSIVEGMTVPEGAPTETYAYYWTFEEDGVYVEYETDGSFPTEVDGEFTGSVRTVLLQKGYEPPIHDFTMMLDGVDYTSEMLGANKALLITSYDFEEASLNDFDKLVAYASEMSQKGYQIFGLTAASMESMNRFYAEYGTLIMWYQCDQTTVKTIIRSNPGLVVLEQGIIAQKTHINDI